MKENYENDVRREDYMSNKDRHLTSIELRKAELDLAERELAIESKRQALKAEQDRDMIRHAMNCKMLNHHGKQFEELQEKDAEEAMGIQQILSGVQIESIRTLLVDAVAEGLSKGK
jgi:hypothetical protein